MSITNIVYLVNVCVVKYENNDEYNRTLQKSETNRKLMKDENFLYFFLQNLN